jgi:hypothetical protein
LVSLYLKKEKKRIGISKVNKDLSEKCIHQIPKPLVSIWSFRPRLCVKTKGVAKQIAKCILLPGVPGILTFIDKNIEPLIFKLLWRCKNNSAVDNSKKLRHKHKIPPRA